MTEFLNSPTHRFASLNSALHEFSVFASDSILVSFGRILRANAKHDQLRARLQFDVGASDRNPDCLPNSAADGTGISAQGNIEFLRSI